MWIVDDEDNVVSLQRTKGENISHAEVFQNNKLDELFRDGRGMMVAIVPESYKKEFKKWLKRENLK
jgi:hypothetical protein